MKYLLLFAFLYVVWWVWSKRKAASDIRSSPPTSSSSEKMVICAQCGVYLPMSERVVENGVVYCSEAHRLAAHKVDD